MRFIFYEATLTSCFLTLDGGRANDECLLEWLSLGTELSGSGLQRHALLGQARDVYGGLLVEARLVVQQRDITAEGQGLASSRSHLEDTTCREDYLMPEMISTVRKSRRLIY